MNRRDFIKSLFATAALTQLQLDNLTEELITVTNDLNDEAFEDYVTSITFIYNMEVHNPAKCVRIINIGE